MEDGDRLIQQIILGKVHLTVQQAISYARLKGMVDYLEVLDYDYFDWLEWGLLNRN